MSTNMCIPICTADVDTQPVGRGAAAMSAQSSGHNEAHCRVHPHQRRPSHRCSPYCCIVESAPDTAQGIVVHMISVGLDGMGLDWIGLDGMGRDGTGRDGTGRDGMGD